MKNEERIIELLVEMVKGQDLTNQKLETLDNRVGKLEKQMSKNSAQIAENTRAILKLANQIELVIDHEKRIGKLERSVFK